GGGGGGGREGGGDGRERRLGARVQQVVRLGRQRVPAQLGPRRHRPHVGGHPPVRGEQLLRAQRPQHAHPGGEDLGGRGGVAGAFGRRNLRSAGIAVQPAKDS